MRANLPTGSYGAPHATASGWFGRLASSTAQLSGRPATLLLATLLVVIWAFTGPIFNYSDTWQLGNQYRSDHHYIFDGFPHSKHPDPRHARSPN
jgi:Low affinity iron permease